jgi:hypothetical protein
MRRICLHLREPTVFGKTLLFGGGPIKAPSIARDLRQKVYSAAEEELHIVFGPPS